MQCQSFAQRGRLRFPTDCMRPYTVYMKVTSSIEKFVGRARTKADALGKSLNQLIVIACKGWWATIRSGASRSSSAFPVAATPAAGTLIEVKCMSTGNVKWHRSPSENQQVRPQWWVAPSVPSTRSQPMLLAPK